MLTLRPGTMEYALVVPRRRAQFQAVLAFQRPLTVSCSQFRPGRATLTPLRAQRFELDPAPKERTRIKIDVMDGKSPLFVNVTVDDELGNV